MRFHHTTAVFAKIMTDITKKAGKYLAVERIRLIFAK